MNEERWLSCTSLDRMLRFLAGKVSDRKLRLFICACCRCLWPLLTDGRSREAVEVAERFADGLATAARLRAAEGAAAACAREEDAACARDASRTPPWAADAAYRAAFDPTASKDAAFANAFVGSRCCVSAAAILDQTWRAGNSRKAARARRAEATMQCHLLRDLSDLPPFRPVTIAPSVLAWNESTLVKLARAAYHERLLPEGTLDKARLSVLADALEESGFSDAQFLGHLRGPGPHVRGCHAVDAILGRG
jgi:hypothetical protein